MKRKSKSEPQSDNEILKKRQKIDPDVLTKHGKLARDRISKLKRTFRFFSWPDSSFYQYDSKFDKTEDAILCNFPTEEEFETDPYFQSEKNRGSYIAEMFNMFDDYESPFDIEEKILNQNRGTDFTYDIFNEYYKNVDEFLRCWQMKLENEIKNKRVQQLHNVFQRIDSKGDIDFSNNENFSEENPDFRFALVFYPPKKSKNGGREFVSFKSNCDHGQMDQKWSYIEYKKTSFDATHLLVFKSNSFENLFPDISDYSEEEVLWFCKFWRIRTRLLNNILDPHNEKFDNLIESLKKIKTDMNFLKGFDTATTEFRNEIEKFENRLKAKDVKRRKKSRKDNFL